MYCILVIAEGVKWLQNMKAPEGNAGLALLALQGWRLYFAKMLKPAKRSDVVFSEQNRIKTYFLFHPRSLPWDCDSENKKTNWIDWHCIQMVTNLIHVTGVNWQWHVNKLNMRRWPLKNVRLLTKWIILLVVIVVNVLSPFAFWFFEAQQKTVPLVGQPETNGISLVCAIKPLKIWLE